MSDFAEIGRGSEAKTEMASRTRVTEGLQTKCTVQPNMRSATSPQHRLPPSSTRNFAMASVTPLSPDSSAPEQDLIPLTPIEPNTLGSENRSGLYGESRPGRRPKFTPFDDLVLVREVAAAKAHVAPNGTTKERFETAAKKANTTKRLSCPVTCKSIQYRYKHIQGRFDDHDRVDALMSGVGGEVGEMEELLISMREARQDMLESRSTSKTRPEERG